MNTLTSPRAGTTDAGTEHLLEVADLHVELMTTRGVVHAVDGVGFHIDPGETVTIIGESGSGKSTTAMALLRLLPDDLAVVSGTARIAGQDVTGSRSVIDGLRGRTVALVPQDPMTALNPIRTVGRQMVEAVRIPDRSLSRGAARARAIELLDSVHVRSPQTQMKAYPHQLSGGMLQRVLIAMALSSEPELIIADEPTSALDVTVQAGILDLLLELQDRTRVGLLLITHDLGVARLMSDRIHVMRAGRFVESGPVERLVADPQDPYTQDLLAAVPQLGDWDETDPDPGGTPGHSDERTEDAS